MNASPDRPISPAEIKEFLALAATAPTEEFNSTAALGAQEVEDRIQNRGLRKGIALNLIKILVCEIIFIGLMIIFQAFSIWGFVLNQAVFSIFTTSVLAQTFLLVRVVVKDLFPSGGRIITS